jgi:hypothetical protein
VRRHLVLAVDLAVLALDLHRRLLLLVRRVDDDEAREAGDLVDFLVHRDAFENVLEPDLTRFLGEDREGVRIPLDQDLALFDRLSFLHLQSRAVDDRIALAVAPLRVLHHQRSAAVHDHEVAVFRLDDVHDATASRSPRADPCQSRRSTGAHARRRTSGHQRNLDPLRCPASSTPSASCFVELAAAGTSGVCPDDGIVRVVERQPPMDTAVKTAPRFHHRVDDACFDAVPSCRSRFPR